MDSLTASIVTGLAVNYFSGFTQPSINDFFAHVFRLRPELERRLKSFEN
jgi:hypothetical protein